MRIAVGHSREFVDCYVRIMRAGFRRYSTYRQATIAGLVTNVVFGLLRIGILLAVLAQRPKVAGYNAADLATFIWLGQGLLGVVLLWGGLELSERIRSGDVVIDLARPWNMQGAMLATDLGRAAHAMLTRFLAPLLIGAVFFPFHWPQRLVTTPAFLVSVLLAVTTSFALRFLLNTLTFWLLDVRGVASLYGIVATPLAGLTVPLAFFPQWLHAALLWTPFPVLLQDPIDVFTEHGSTLDTLGRQAFWTVATLALGQLLLHRATRKVVVHGG